MRLVKRRGVFLNLVLTALIALSAAAITSPAHAVATAMGNFYAGCGNFSVDFAVSGSEDDGNAQDKLRVRLIDGNNKVLYQEDGSIHVGYSVGSLVVNLPYQQRPDKNPVRFSIINLDANGNEKGESAAVTYNVPCFAAAGGVTRSGIYKPPSNYSGQVLTTTPVYDAPNGNKVNNITINAGTSQNIIYRSPDAAWIAIFAGGNDLVWVPISTITADPKVLTVPPTKVIGSGLFAGANDSGAAPQQPTGTVGTTRGYLRIRSEPSTRAAVLGVLNPKTTITLVGRNSRSTWVKISYGNFSGWVSTYYLVVNYKEVRALPVTQ